MPTDRRRVSGKPQAIATVGGVMFPLFLFFVWILLVVVLPLLEKAAHGKSGGVSIFPGLPVCPLAVWGLAALLNGIKKDIGYYIIGGLHIVLLILMIGYSAKYVYEIKRKAK